MKRRELLRRLRQEGCVFLRAGGKHDIYVNPKTGKKQPVLRHSEIDEHLARHILRYLGLEQ
ncbi:MAG: type II toxin-antitoxin system HicA family toxin [Planctomycetes bacterium]|nr:type II toxin-antitoxin system HicA family toxin [Planctomycetota bacterium]